MNMKMTMNEKGLAKTKALLHGAQHILITSHMRPDGDAIGSLLGLGLALQDAKKEVQMILADGVPKTFRHLVGSDQIRKKPEGEFDTLVVVDCSDLDRVGEYYSQFPAPDLNIDHHVTNKNFAKINLVDTQATATAEMVAEHLPALGLTMTKAIAEALLTGIITDTIGFRTTNMRPEALRTAADLMSTGISLPSLYRKALHSRTFVAARYWGTGLNNLEISDRLVWATLKLEDRRAVAYPGNDDADLVNILATIEEADVALIFIEQSEDKVKVSWRARPGFDVSKIAAQFGGGGHKPASGATIKGSLEEVQSRVIESTKVLFNGK
jgi:bifunctional oligoribonuclease and PAP phosphatase NrnA